MSCDLSRSDSVVVFVVLGRWCLFLSFLGLRKGSVCVRPFGFISSDVFPRSHVVGVVYLFCLVVFVFF